MSPQEKRRLRDVERKHREQIDQLHVRHRDELMQRESTARNSAFALGKSEGIKESADRAVAAIKEAEGRSHAAGVKVGAAQIRELVLQHAGRLYTERKDTDAAAVREVHRLLSIPA